MSEKINPFNAIAELAKAAAQGDEYAKTALAILEAQQKQEIAVLEAELAVQNARNGIDASTKFMTIPEDSSPKK
jgi:hypothetical protein